MSQLMPLLVFLGGVALLVLFGHSLFRFLGRFAEKARPTAENEARPGHQNLGAGILVLLLPLMLTAFYNARGVIVDFLERPQLMSALYILVGLVLMPLAGAIGLLQWKNARIEFVGNKIATTNALGNVSVAETVLSESMTPPVRNPGPVWFELGSGRVRADTSWINIKRQYDLLAAVGVPVEPWREKATWDDVWGRK